jgi:hypothetical protein
VYPGERRLYALRVAGWMDHSGRHDILRKNQMCRSYQNRTPELSVHTINTVLLFIIIFITDFKLTGLECGILNLNIERYTIHEAMEFVLNLETKV